jgi:hypothetical protein
MDDLLRVEGAVSATASGNLTYGLWPYDSALAMGMSGHRCPIGFAVVRYLSGGGAAALLGLVLILTTRLLQAGVAGPRAADASLRAIELWNDRMCHGCDGSGTVGLWQSEKQCMVCDGTGERRISGEDAEIRCAYDLLVEAEQQFEGLMRVCLAKGG